MRTAIASILLGLVLAAALLAPAWPHDRALATKDAGHLFPSIKQRVLAAWGEGGLPTWQLEVGCGGPLLADPMAQALYPPNLVFAGTDPLTGMKRFVALHVVLLVAGFAALARRRGARPIVALAAAIAWVGSGPVLSQHWSVLWMGGLVGLLAALLGLEALVGERRRAAAVPWIVGGLVWMVLAGAYEVVVGFGVWAALALAAEGVALRRAACRPLVRFGVAAVLAAGLAAIQLLPTAELRALSNRAHGLPLEQAAFWSLPPVRLLELVAPGLFGNPADGTSWAMALTRQSRHPVPYLGGIFVGAAALALATGGVVAGWRREGRARRQTLVLGAVALGACVLALGDATPALALVRRLVPFAASFRYPEKCLTLASVPLVLLAAGGLEAWLRGQAAVRTAVARTAGALAALCGLVLALALVLGPGALATLQPRFESAGIRASTAGAWGLAVLALAGGGVLALLTWAFARLVARRPRLAAGGLVGLFALLPPVVNRALIGVQPRAKLLARPASLPSPAALRTPLGPLRIATEHRRFEPHHAALLGYRTENEYGATQLAIAARFARLLERDPVRRYRLASVACVYGERAAGGGQRRPAVLGVRDPLPRALLVPEAIVLPDEGAWVRALGSAGWRIERVVLLAPGAQRPAPAPAVLETGAAGAGRGSLRLLEERGALLRFAARVPAACWLLVNDSWAPGWEAEIDGRSVRLERANYRFRAVAVPAGRHEVVLRYRPSSVRRGAAISLATAVVVVLLGVFRRFRRGVRPRP